MKSNGEIPSHDNDRRDLPEYGKIRSVPKFGGSSKEFKAVRIKVVLFGLVFLGIIIGSGIALNLYQSANQTFSNEVPPSGTNGSEQLTKRVTFLLVGVDQRPKEQNFLADSIILASLDPDTKIMSLLSIPRDSKVLNNIKINEVAYTYGMSKLVTMVSEITGVRIDGYVKTNFDGFKEIIDTLGGIDIFVEINMKKDLQEKEDGTINLEKGMQHLDGTKALQYARYRDDLRGDIPRAARQQKVIMTIVSKALQPEIIPKLPQLISQVNNVVETDLKLTDLLKLAGMAKDFDSDNIVSATLPGQSYWSPNGTSYWQIDSVAAKKTAANLLKGISTNKVVTGPDIDLR